MLCSIATENVFGQWIRLLRERENDSSVSSYLNSLKSSTQAAASLYVPDGHNHLPADYLNDDRLAPLTRWTQTYIYNHQHPAICNTSQLLISTGLVSGFGSEMHVIGAHLAYAIQNNYVLVLGPSACLLFRVPHNCTKGCECLFRPISSCGNDTALFADPTVKRIGGHQNMSNHMPDIFKEALLSQFPSMTRHQIRYWWRGQSAAYLMRFNDDTVRGLAALRQTQALHYMTGGKPLPFPLPAGTISAHIRGGDKANEMKLVPAAKFVDAALALIDRMPNSFSRVFFLSGDDEQTINETRALLEGQAMTFAFTRLPRLSGGHKLLAWLQSPFHEAGGFYGHLLQLVMALEADAWIGTRGSNWNRLIDELRCVWVDKCGGVYVEVGDQGLGKYYW